ncbi:hypothetical protein GDO78_001805 [Eleutherodactylus coqui]|uniref:Uncharacterized protein n=1 Tax=Eleutherodactylus coqui TaxID=57060 RepID=A0A8J6FU13_ELECQ|nr:hypothetical protein GDO78_001805 [Eleutherodactylus coqui]
MLISCSGLPGHCLLFSAWVDLGLPPYTACMSCAFWLNINSRLYFLGINNQGKFLCAHLFLSSLYASCLHQYTIEDNRKRLVIGVSFIRVGALLR